jgi:hypothetical protein
MLVVESLLLTKFLRINTMLPKILICFERVRMKKILSSTRMQWVSLRINYIAVVKDNVKKQLRTRTLTMNATLQKYLTKMLIYEINFKCFSFDGCTNPSWKLKKEFYVRSFFENIFRDLSSFSPCCHYHLTCTIISFLDVSATEYEVLPCMCILVNNFF